MSINNVNNTKASIDAAKLAQHQSNNQAAKAGPGNASQAATAAKQDSVSLTQSAQQLANVQKKGSEAPVNQEKVDRLKKAIAAGEYKVNPEALAKKMAVLESQIFGSKV